MVERLQLRAGTVSEHATPATALAVALAGTTRAGMAATSSLLSAGAAAALTSAAVTRSGMGLPGAASTLSPRLLTSMYASGRSGPVLGSPARGTGLGAGGAGSAAASAQAAHDSSLLGSPGHIKAWLELRRLLQQHADKLAERATAMQRGVAKIEQLADERALKASQVGHEALGLFLGRWYLMAHNLLFCIASTSSQAQGTTLANLLHADEAGGGSTRRDQQGPGWGIRCSGGSSAPDQGRKVQAHARVVCMVAEA